MLVRLADQLSAADEDNLKFLARLLRSESVINATTARKSLLSWTVTNAVGLCATAGNRLLHSDSRFCRPMIAACYASFSVPAGEV